MRVKKTKFKKIKNLAVAFSLLFTTACNNGIPTINNQDTEGISSNVQKDELQAFVKLIMDSNGKRLKFNTKSETDSESLTFVLESKDGAVLAQVPISYEREGVVSLKRFNEYRLKLKSNDKIIAESNLFVADIGVSVELTIENVINDEFVNIPVIIKQKEVVTHSNKESINFSGGVVSPTPTPSPTSTPVPVDPIPLKTPFLLVLNEYQGSDGIRDIPKKDFIFLDVNNGNIIKDIKNPTNSDLNGVSLNSAGNFIFQPSFLNYSMGNTLYSNPISVGFKDEALQEFGKIQPEQPYHYLYPINDRVEKRIVNPEYWITSELFIANNNIYQIKDDSSHELFELTEEEFNRIEGSSAGGDVNRNHQVVAVYNRTISLVGINRLIKNLYYFGDFKSVTNPRFEANSDDKVLFLEKLGEKWSLNRISTTASSTPSQLLDISSLISISKPTRVSFEYDLYGNVLFFAFNGQHTEIISYNLASNRVIFAKTYSYKSLLPSRIFFDNGLKMNNSNKVIDSFDNSYHQPTTSTYTSDAEHTYQEYVPSNSNTGLSSDSPNVYK